MDKILQIKTDLLMREWAQMVRECRSSRLTVKEWFANNGINTKTYYYRLKRGRGVRTYSWTPIVVPKKWTNNTGGYYNNITVQFVMEVS